MPDVRQVARWALGPLRYRTVTVPFGSNSGLKFNPQGSAPSYALGISEMNVQRRISGILGQAGTFYDVGANVGFYSVFAAACVGATGHVYSFEPVPENARGLRRNLQLNEVIQDNYFIREVALSDSVGLRSFTTSQEPFWGSLEPRSFVKRPSRVITVRTSTLDEEIRHGGLRAPDVIKIDVEGHEIEVLRGASATLCRSKPAIVIEFHENRNEITDFLLQFGYDIEVIPAFAAKLRKSRHLIATHPED